MKRLEWLCAIAVALVATACTDYRSDWRNDNSVFWAGFVGSEEENPSEENPGVSMDSVETEDDLLNCTSAREGFKVFVKDPGDVFVCHEALWNPEEVTPEETSSESKNPTSSSSRTSKGSCKSSDILEVVTTFLAADGDYDTYVDERDCQEYRIVTIGGHVWMAQNLNYEAEDGGSRCVADDPENCDMYGRLYTWSAASEACPEGWSLPKKADFDDLLELAYGEPAAEASLATSYSGMWEGDGDNALGFSAVPAGYSALENDSEVGVGANFWTSTVAGTNAFFMYIFNEGGMEADIVPDYPQTHALSVRCVKDK